MPEHTALLSPLSASPLGSDTRCAARRAAITALGGADELHDLTTERLVELAAAAGDLVGEQT